MIKIRQDVTRLKNIGMKAPNRHYSKDEAKSTFSSENAIIHFLKVIYLLFENINNMTGPRQQLL